MRSEKISFNWLIWAALPVALTLPALARADGEYAGATFKRTNLLVSDLDRSLSVYRDILGFELAGRAKAVDDSYIYKLFQLPIDAVLHFALLSAGPEQQRVIALVEVTGVEIRRRRAPYTSSVVLGVTDLAGIIGKISGLGLDVAPANLGSGADGSQFMEQAFVDFDGNVVLLYEWQAH